MTRTVAICLILTAALLLPAPANAEMITLENWEYRWGDSPVSADGSFEWLSDAPGAPGWQKADRLFDPGGRKQEDWLWLRTRLPATGLQHPGLSIPGVSEAFEVYVGTELIYSRGVLEPGKNPYYPIYVHLASLPPGFAGRTLALRIHSGGGTIGVRAPDAAVAIGTEPELMVTWARMSVGQLIVGGISIFIGLVLLFAFAVQRRPRVWMALTLGCFCLLAGVFYASQSQLAPMVLGSAALVFYLRTVTLLLFPIAVYVFIEQVTGQSRLVRACWVVHAIYATVVIAADVSGVMRLTEAWQSSQILLAVTLVAAIVAGVRAAWLGVLLARQIG